MVFFKEYANPSLFLFILVLFKHKFFRKKTVAFSGIWTWIVGVEGKHADHLTTTTALYLNFSCQQIVGSLPTTYCQRPDINWRCLV